MRRHTCHRSSTTLTRTGNCSTASTVRFPHWPNAAFCSNSARICTELLTIEHDFRNCNKIWISYFSNCPQFVAIFSFDVKMRNRNCCSVFCVLQLPAIIFKLQSQFVSICHNLLSFVIICYHWSSFVIIFKLSSFVILCYHLLSFVIICVHLSSFVTICPWKCFDDQKSHTPWFGWSNCSPIAPRQRVQFPESILVMMHLFLLEWETFVYMMHQEKFWHHFRAIPYWCKYFIIEHLFGCRFLPRSRSRTVRRFASNESD